jgi:hypothetical protein
LAEVKADSSLTVSGVLGGRRGGKKQTTVDQSRSVFLKVAAITDWQIVSLNRSTSPLFSGWRRRLKLSLLWLFGSVILGQTAREVSLYGNLTLAGA